MRKLSLKNFTKVEKLCHNENAHYVREDDRYQIHLIHKYFKVDKHTHSHMVWVAVIIYKDRNMESTEFMHNKLKETMDWVNMIISLC